MEEGRHSVRIFDVHLVDQASTLFARRTFSWDGKDDGDDEEGGGVAEVVEETVLQMSKLGLPTSFSSAPRSHRSRRRKKSRSRDQVTTSLVSLASLSDSVQASLEGSVEDDPVRVSDDQVNHSADADTLASSRVSTDDGTKDGEASASNTSCPTQMYELAGDFVDEMDALLLNREPTSCERAKMADMDMAASAQVMAANDNNLLFDQAKRLLEDVSMILNDRAFSLDEGYVFSPVEVAEHESYARDSQPSDIRCSNWSACWDAYYGRYYFYNSETQESTWEPPVGLEAYGSVTFVQGSNNQGHVTSSDFVADEKEVSIEEDPKMCGSQHEASCAQFVCKRSNEEGTSERVVKAGGALTATNNVASLVDDALSSMEHGEIVFSDSSCLHLAEVGAIADSASCPQVAMEIDNVQVEASTMEIFSKGASLENYHWSVCWDDYYGRHYFYNAETSESTWEPPKGFEAYANKDSNNFSDGALKSVVFFSKENKAEITLEDSSEMGTLLQAAEVVSSSRDSKQSSSRKESEKEVVLEFESLACQEASTGTTEGGIAHVEAANGKVTGLRGRLKKAAQYFLQLANQHEDDVASSPTILKYWFQRFHLFSKYDFGIKLDEEGWFSVTPEAIAKHQAARCKGSVIIDAFTGVGGNAIQFALAGQHVIAIDNDPNRIEYAHHNAKVYGVADCIDFVLGDFFTVSSSMQADVVFLSPPWGGPDYLNAPVYDILTMLQPKDGTTLLNAAHSVAPNIILYLPRNVDMNQLAELPRTLSFPCSCEVERNFLNGKLKAITAYYGQFTCVIK